LHACGKGPFKRKQDTIPCLHAKRRNAHTVSLFLDRFLDEHFFSIPLYKLSRMEKHQDSWTFMYSPHIIKQVFKKKTTNAVRYCFTLMSMTIVCVGVRGGEKENHKDIQKLETSVLLVGM
jgi:hypothetical protein